MAKKRGNGEGSIYKRKDGRWAAKYTSVDGKRKEVYAKTRKEVARKLAEAVSGREENPSTEGTPKLGEYLSSWLNGSVKGSVRERTFDRYDEISRKHQRLVTPYRKYDFILRRSVWCRPGDRSSKVLPGPHAKMDEPVSSDLLEVRPLLRSSSSRSSNRRAYKFIPSPAFSFRHDYN